MKTVWTNGVFDIVHVGHLRLLRYARSLGDRLVVGLNSDRSVRELKGPTRPIIPEAERAEMLEAIRWVDHVIIFDEPTPENLVRELSPDVLVKGGDWKVAQIAGAQWVLDHGGRVDIFPLVDGRSTTSTIQAIQEKIPS